MVILKNSREIVDQYNQMYVNSINQFRERICWKTCFPNRAKW